MASLRDELKKMTEEITQEEQKLWTLHLSALEKLKYHY